MSEWILANGGVLTDEEIEAECAKWEAGTWEGHLTNYHAGRPAADESREPLVGVSVRLPASMVAAIDRRGGSRSDFIRRAVAASL